ncbi:hypothetical protein GCM10017691_48420 [Pseudonocardia petroleophila]|uniref:hypothetical protein n=1 Tax=Pseudonocardia petroleophila TaxID=37331 RepID=UPI0031CE9D0B
MASDKNSTLVMPFRIEMLRFFENASGGAKPAGAGATPAADEPATAAVDPAPARTEVNGSTPAAAITTGPEADRS